MRENKRTELGIFDFSAKFGNGVGVNLRSRPDLALAVYRPISRVSLSATTNPRIRTFHLLAWRRLA